MTYKKTIYLYKVLLGSHNETSYTQN